MWRACLHIGVANTLALSAAGVILPSSSSEIQPKVLIDTVPGGKTSLDKVTLRNTLNKVTLFQCRCHRSRQRWYECEYEKITHQNAVKMQQSLPFLNISRDRVSFWYITRAGDRVDHVCHEQRTNIRRQNEIHIGRLEHMRTS